MKFIMFVIDTGSNTGNTQEMQAIDAFNESLQQQGHWVFAAGIGAPETGNLFDFRAKNQEVTAGSLFTSPEFYSGFWIIDAPDAQKAQELAKQASHACNRRVELRPFLGS